MFVVSVKSSKLKIAVAVVAVGIFVLLGVLYVSLQHKAQPVSSSGGIDLRAETDEERIAFLSQFGWRIEEAPLEVKEVLIPAEFDDTYASYNALQLQQNFDLVPFQGQRVKEWSYAVLNYPGYENNRDAVRANLLVADGVVIGGDISAVALDGFMQGFEMPSASSFALENPTLQTVE